MKYNAQIIMTIDASNSTAIDCSCSSTKLVFLDYRDQNCILIKLAVNVLIYKTHVLIKQPV